MANEMPERSTKSRRRHVAASVLCGLLVLTIVTSPPSQAASPVPPEVLIEDGRFPSLVIDAAGEQKTIHDTWYGPAPEEEPGFSTAWKWFICAGLAVLAILAVVFVWNRGLSREVKERKQAEEALRISEARHREAQRIASVGHWEWNLETGEHWLSEEHSSILGRPEGGVFDDAKMAIENVVHPEDRAMVLRRREELIGEGKAYDIDFRIVNPDGAIRHVHSLAEVQRGPDGTPIRVHGVTQDITERKQAEEALRESEETNRVLFETMAQGVVFQDAAGNIISVNPAAEAILGVTFEQMTGRTSMDPRWRAMREDGSPFPGEAHPSMIALKTGKKVNDELMGVFNPGMNEIRWININAVPRFRPGEDTPYQAYATFDDITERKRAAERLRMAKEEAEFANYAKTVFLATMSHELRTPLNCIIGFAQMLGSEIFGPLGSDKYREYANDIGRSGAHLLKVIKDLLDISKIEAGTTELVEEEVDIHQIIEICVGMVRDRAVQSGVELVNEVSSGLPVLYADPTQLKQILLNLLTNAIKFTAAGGRITVAADLGEDRRLAVKITDTGSGIAAADIPWVLEPFGQVSDVMTRSHDGAGLGLPLAKSMTELHGGTFDLESEVGVGTTVTVCFPAERVVGG
jgi:signal transduction histidine kinase